MNAVYISLSYDGEDKRRDTFWMRDCNWIASQLPDEIDASGAQQADGAGIEAAAAVGAQAAENAVHDDDGQHAASLQQLTCLRERAQEAADAQHSHAASHAPGMPLQHHAAGACPLRVRIRHGPGMYDVKAFKWQQKGASAYIELWQNDQGIAPGQFAVFYRGDECLGSGVISGGVATRTGEASVQAEEGSEHI